MRFSETMSAVGDPVSGYSLPSKLAVGRPVRGRRPVELRVRQRLGHARAWCWIQLTQLEDDGLLERGGDGGAEDPWRFRRRVETLSRPREGATSVAAPPLTAAQLLDRLHRDGVRAWISPRSHTQAPSVETTPPDGATGTFDWGQP
jgi:hypothetical protein